jgi:hypothetical protein
MTETYCKEKNMVQIIQDHKLNMLELDSVYGSVYGTDKHIPKTYIENFYEKEFFKFKNKSINMFL